MLLKGVNIPFYVKFLSVNLKGHLWYLAPAVCLTSPKVRGILSKMTNGSCVSGRSRRWVFPSLCPGISALAASSFFTSLYRPIYIIHPLKYRKFIVGQCQHGCWHCLLLLISVTKLRCITKWGLHGSLSYLQRMSGMAMGWDINSGVDKRWNLIARYVAITSDFHVFFAFFAFSWKLFIYLRGEAVHSLFFLLIPLFWAKGGLYSLKIGKDTSFWKLKTISIIKKNKKNMQNIVAIFLYVMGTAGWENENCASSVKITLLLFVSTAK
jgi:hypothetical protein